MRDLRRVCETPENENPALRRMQGSPQRLQEGVPGQQETNHLRESSVTMAGETAITVVGNLTNDPELRFTPSGAAVANFTIASTPRTFDKNSNGWKDGETLFLRANIWKEAAENVAETLTKGMRVIVQGRLKSRSYDTKEGEKRTVIELEVEEVGPSLKYASAKVNRTQRSGGQQPRQQAQADPWGASTETPAWGNEPASADPPF